MREKLIPVEICRRRPDSIDFTTRPGFAEGVMPHRHGRPRGLRIGLRVGEFGPCALECHLVVSRVDGHEHGAGGAGVVCHWRAATVPKSIAKSKCIT